MPQAEKKPDQKNTNKGREKRPRPPNPTDGKHTPFAAEMNKRLAEEERIKTEARKKREAERAAAEEKRKEAEHRAKHASIFNYADEVKQRHPDIPNDLLEKIKASKTGAEAKRLVKDWAIEKAKASQPV